MWHFDPLRTITCRPAQTEEKNHATSLWVTYGKHIESSSWWRLSRERLLLQIRSHTNSSWCCIGNNPIHWQKIPPPPGIEPASHLVVQVKSSIFDHLTTGARTFKDKPYGQGNTDITKKMLKRREECDTYLTHICRHRWGRGSPVKRLNIGSFQPKLRLSSAVDVDSMSTADESQVLAESSLYFIFSPGSFCSINVYIHESGRWHILPFLLTFFVILPFQVFLLY